jgi:hypothetical protein
LLKNAGGKVVLGEPTAGFENFTSNFTGSIDDLELNFASSFDKGLFLQKDLVVNNDLTITQVGLINGSGGTFNIKVKGDVITNDASFVNNFSAINW